MTKKIILSLLMFTALVAASCKKKTTTTTSTDKRVPPDLTLKTGTGYITKDTTVTKQDTLVFGIKVTKTEDNLTSFNASYAYDASTTTTTFFNHTMTTSEYTGYNTDVQYVTRNQSGTETLTFSVVDRDGNISKKTIVLTIP